MGRETKILLGLLGTLAFVFLGALLARLFVARPPVGVGVDVYAELSQADAAPIVAPPELGRPSQSAFSAVAAATTSVQTLPDMPPAMPPDAADVAAEPAGEPERTSPVSPASPLSTPASSAVVPASFETPADQPGDSGQIRQAREIRQGSACTVVEGDAWWSLAEAAYGDGRLYRALYAWNRKLDSRVALLPGTKLVVPTKAELAAAYPGLLPASGPRENGR